MGVRRCPKWKLGLELQDSVKILKPTELYTFSGWTLLPELRFNKTVKNAHLTEASYGVKSKAEKET